MKKQILSVLKSDIAKSSTMIFIVFFSSGFMLFLAEIYLSNKVGPEIFGRFRTVIYLFSFLILLTELGIGVTITKYISEFGKSDAKKRGHLIKWFFKIRIVSYLLLMIFIFLLREQLAATFLKDASLSYLIDTGILLVGMTFFNMFSYIILGYQKFKLYAIAYFLNAIYSAIIAVLLIPFGIFYVIVGWSFGPLIGNILNIKFFFDKKILKNAAKFDAKKIFWKFSMPIYLTDMPTALFSFSVPLLSMFFSQLLIGYYSFALIFYSATLVISNSISTVIFPKVSELNGQKRQDIARNILKKAFILYSLVFIFGMGCIILISDWLFNSFFSNYLQSLPMFKILVACGLLFGFNIIYVNYLKGLGKVKKYALFTFMQNILLILISFILLSIS